jgi:hypothetical protein
MTRKSLALATADPVRHALSAQIPEGRTGYRRGQHRNAGLTGVSKLGALVSF